MSTAATALPDVGRLRASYATVHGVLLCHDSHSGDAACHIAPPTGPCCTRPSAAGPST